MLDLGLDPNVLSAVFMSARTEPYALIEIDPQYAASLADHLSTAVRRCYISDTRLTARATATGRPQSEVITSKLPDKGSTMAGDFGEILTSLLQIALDHPTEVLDPWKWRLKADRTKPASGSDIVQFVLPDWPNASEEDRLICSEVKTKSTKSKSSPIAEAIADSRKDSARRLPKTLAWLREKALDPGIESVSLEQVERFIDAVDHPPASREYRAVAVICSSLVAEEINDIEVPPKEERAVVVLSIPALKQNYEAVYDAALRSSAEEANGC